MSKKKIGIIGSGLVAQVLGSGFLNHGYEVMLGTRDIQKLNDWKVKENNQAKVGTTEEAVKFGEIIVLAVKGDAAEMLVRQLSGDLSGKTVIDTTNPIADAAPENGVLKFTTDLNQSLMEKLQKAVPTAHFVKAFSSVGSHLMVNPRLSGGQPTMFIAGNNETAKREVKEILTIFDWETADMGKAEAARAIEPLCMLWCIPGFIRNEWSHAFKLLKA
jgi:8-hydroxy-5-deazaflavin:NADPH oxidoreductase